MGAVWKVAVGAPALLFIVVGLLWWGTPGFAGQQLGMPLLSDVGLSTQIGDLASFFLTLGACVVIGLATGDRIWLYPALMLLGFAMAGRFIAWLVHDAALPVAMLAVEGVVVIALLVTSRQLTNQHTGSGVPSGARARRRSDV